MGQDLHRPRPKILPMFLIVMVVLSYIILSPRATTEFIPTLFNRNICRITLRLIRLIVFLLVFLPITAPTLLLAIP